MNEGVLMGGIRTIRVGLRHIPPASWAPNVRFALRTMGRRPGYSGSAILTFALGIGANVAIFTVINAYILRPFPIEDPARVVWLSDFKEGRAGFVSAPDFVDWREQSRSFEDLVAVHVWPATLTQLVQPMRVARARVTPGFFNLIGVQPMIGRSFFEEEGLEGNDRVAVLSYDIWSGAYGADPAVVGKTVVLDGIPSTIVGVLPAGFFMPPFTSQIWGPLAFDQETLEYRGRHSLRVVGRLADGVSLDAATAEMDVVAEGLARAYPQSNEGWGIQVQELREQVLRGSAGSLWMLFGGVGLVLLIACVNVASLMVARGAGRKQELAVRVALGASRGQLLRQLLTENLLLALVGGALGLGVAYLGLEPMKTLVPSSLADIGVLSIDRGVLAFAVLASAVTGLVSGAIPGFRLSGSALSGGRIAGVLRTRPGGFGARSGLVVAEFALAMILLVGAGLFLRSLANLYSVDLGFEPSGTTTFGLTFPTVDYRAPEEVVAVLDAVLVRFAAADDVEAMAATSHLPLTAGRLLSSLQLDGDKEEMSTNSPSAAIKVVSPGYFELLGIPLSEGRFLNDDDDSSSEPAVVINESAARRFWPGESAVGRALAYTEDAAGAPVERRVVGVVGDVLWAGPQGEATEEVYQSHRQTTEVWGWSARAMSFVTRAGRGEALSLSRAQGMVSEIDPNMPVVAFRPYGEIVDGNVAAPRFQGALLGLFAALALILAAVGTYSVMAFSVRQRTREIGVRLAVGADRADVMASVLLDGAKLALVGVAVGALGALLLSRLISSLLWGVGGSDPLTYVVVAAVLSGVTLLASYVPARRASRVNPIVALRDD